MSEDVDDLKQFLSEQASAGQFTGVGGFTLELRQALKKLSAFQLPFAGCWALKLIQAAVASGCSTAIRVTISARSIKFDFEGSFDWSGGDIQLAILNPANKTSGSLNHLAIGLRVLSFHLDQRWSLSLGEAGDLLTWEGDAFQVTQCQPSEGVQLVLNRELASTLPQSIRNALTERAYVCPVPLHLDGRRLDALDLSPQHGYGTQSQPIAMGFPKGELTTFVIPLATGSPHLKTETPIQQPLRAATEFARAWKLPKDGRCSLAFSLAVHIEREAELILFKSWNYKESENHRYWIYDGVIVEIEPFGKVKLACSVGCFLSAQGLTLDAGGFGLIDGAEKRQRIFRSRQLLRSGMSEIGQLDHETLIAHQKNRSQMKASLLLLGGLLSLPASTAVAGFLVVLGAAGFAASESTQAQAWQKTINSALKELKKSL